jgi:hypothetical protein
MVLGVRVPKHLGGTGGTSGIVSSTGEVSDARSFQGAESERLGADDLNAKMFFISSYSPTYSPTYYHHNEVSFGTTVHLLVLIIIRLNGSPFNYLLIQWMIPPVGTFNKIDEVFFI